MDLEKQNTWSGQRKFIFIIFLCFAFSVTGCGPSYEERQAKKEVERKELIRKKEAKVKILSDQISEKYNAICFPPEGLGAAAFTYELQKFLSADVERAVLFKGYLEDVEKTEHGIVIEFICPLLGEEFYLSETVIRFRLTTAEEKVKQFLAVKGEDPIFRLLRYFSVPDYFVVAKIAELKRSRRYEFFGSASGDVVEIDVKIHPSFVSTGKLVEAIPIPND
ncbi:MAG: hypothetical protein ISS29_09220 [Candidatus Marinimicrobia bacterium]|nr:hypothetical protein [Candidatus Neomarinimicrobiota bacterium]